MDILLAQTFLVAANVCHQWVVLLVSGLNWLENGIDVFGSKLEKWIDEILNDPKFGWIETTVTIMCRGFIGVGLYSLLYHYILLIAGI